MKHRLFRALFLLFLAAVSPAALQQDQQYGKLQEDPKLPNGKSQRDEILKAEHADNIRDAARLVDLANGLKADLEKTDTFVLSMNTIKKTDDIEKLAKKIRDRLRH
ncbi:MAG TPA: hypothetical protein VHW09_20730 [Bryobacteraceae bacterium]|nr:hypothetical protein [Bryobacteraceae bacterium]